MAYKCSHLSGIKQRCHSVPQVCCLPYLWGYVCCLTYHGYHGYLHRPTWPTIPHHINNLHHRHLHRDLWSYRQSYLHCCHLWHFFWSVIHRYFLQTNVCEKHDLLWLSAWVHGGREDGMVDCYQIGGWSSKHYNATVMLHSKYTRNYSTHARLYIKYVH